MGHTESTTGTGAGPLGGKNIVLIGMVGSGKTTIGLHLSAELKMPLIDTDDLIMANERRKLSVIIEEEGRDGFLKVEERNAMSLDVQGHIISTGGSMIYSPGAMESLKESGVILGLNCPLADLEVRLGDLDARGVVRAAGQTLGDLLDERMPLIEKWSDHLIDAGGDDVGAVVDRAVAALGVG